jgi:hypothetical protein
MHHDTIGMGKEGRRSGNLLYNLVHCQMQGVIIHSQKLHLLIYLPTFWGIWPNKTVFSTFILSLDLHRSFFMTCSSCFPFYCFFPFQAEEGEACVDFNSICWCVDFAKELWLLNFWKLIKLPDNCHCHPAVWIFRRNELWKSYSLVGK